ncbi:MAG: insulinase family protein [Burkholderiales bacterium]|nr:insulinase family protein [Burkholderiales bacterium]
MNFRLVCRRAGEAALLAVIALFATPAFTNPAFAAPKTNEAVLSNELRVIVKEDNRAPVVVSMVWYRAGSMDEVNGKTGVAHVLEHMMFKGTKDVPAGEFNKLVAAAGGRDNAFTNRDYTAYFQQVQKSELPLMLRLEADRMANLNLTDEEFAKEIKVVMEERRLRTDDKARALLYEQLLATTYSAHPYRTPVIGWMNDLENMKAEDARQWYRDWYAPNNATLVVVGDVKAAEVFKLAEQYFGKIKARPLPARKPQDEPIQAGERRIVVKAPAELPHLVMAYHVPKIRDVEQDWEPYALDVLDAILDGHEGARLTRSLVRGSRIASSAGSSYDSVARGPTLFFLDGTPSDGKTVQELETALRKEIQNVAEHGVSEEELARVKAQVIAGEVFQRDSMFYQAMQIGSLETAGLPHQSVDVQIEKLKAVTAAQVQEVAKKYFRDDVLTVAVLDPQPLDGTRRVSRVSGVRHAE